MKKMFVLFAVFLIASITLFAQDTAGKKDIPIPAPSYVCPMHADVTSAEPGKCSKCGMDLILSPKEKMKMEVMKNYTCSKHPDVVSENPGKCPKCGTDLILSPKEKMKMEVMKMYTCSMHPEVVSENPGKCPKCGMELVKKKHSRKNR